jgi:hypothetical protein
MSYPREAEKDHLYNRVILLTVACCVLLLLAAMARHEGLAFAAIKLGEVEITGTVTYVGDIPRNSAAKIVHYDYVDQDGQLHEDRYRTGGYDQSISFETGQNIPLVYSAWFPGISSPATQLGTLRPGFIIMSGGVLLTLLLLGISYRTMGRISAMKREDRFY